MLTWHQQHSEQPNTRNESLSTKPYGHGTNATNVKETVSKKISLCNHHPCSMALDYRYEDEIARLRQQLEQV